MQIQLIMRDERTIAIKLEGMTHPVQGYALFCYRRAMLMHTLIGNQCAEVLYSTCASLSRNRSLYQAKLGTVTTHEKDRNTLLSNAAYAIVPKYIEQQKPDPWLFPGQTPGRHLIERSAQKVFEKALSTFA